MPRRARLSAIFAAPLGVVDDRLVCDRDDDCGRNVDADRAFRTPESGAWLAASDNELKRFCTAS